MMWKKTLSLSWLQYHLSTFTEFLIVYHPFRTDSKSVPAYFTPPGTWSTFIFFLIISVLIYGPIILFMGNLLIVGMIIPEFFIITGFGIVFGTIIRIIQHGAATALYYDGQTLTYTHYDFYEKKVEHIAKSNIKGLVRIRDKVKSTDNHKICVVLSDDRIIMLRLTIFKKKAQRLLGWYCQLFELDAVERPSHQRPINDHGAYT